MNITINVASLLSNPIIMFIGAIFCLPISIFLYGLYRKLVFLFTRLVFVNPENSDLLEGICLLSFIILGVIFVFTFMY